jgi:uncharacterized protein
MKKLTAPVRLSQMAARITLKKSYTEQLQATFTEILQWVMLEPNGETLWARVRSTISDCLINEWQKGVLLGTKPEQAFFVRCDRTTMTQADLDNGRLICLVGVAPVKPAEFVIIRIDQRTAAPKA